MPVYAIAIFLSAALLFLVQPLTGKLLLPLLGGSPSVWNTCMVFFQGILLAGYLYSHLISKVRSVGVQAALHACVLGGAWLTLPIAVPASSPDSTNPIAWLLPTLLRTVGLPFFCVATTGPLVQRWFSRTDRPGAQDPYFLYAASNAGSVVGLLAYPIVLEPLLTRHQQASVWAVGFGVLCAALALTVFATLRRLLPATPPEGGASPLAQPAPGWARRVRWTLLAFAPSSLMIGVTQSISTDLAAVPLLWILPLLLYLVSFILAFSSTTRLNARLMGRVLPILMIPLLAVMLMSAKSPLLPIVFIHHAVFFIGATMCHRSMAEDRPPVEHLTEFYLWMSVGGVLGGVVNALAAPARFDRVIEY
ncbi:MAG: spermidine synthase, partial [Phycisphaerales bacterium]